jgi:hypothetical protein
MTTHGVLGSSPRGLSPPLAILWIGAVAGTLDITEDLIFVALHGITPAMVFRYIASGLLGPAATAVGLAPVLLGVVLHYAIAFAWTALFYLANRKLEALRRHAVASGVLYGGFVYLVMTQVVVPLSRVPHGVASTSLAARVNGVLAVVICIGLTISLLSRRLGPPPSAQAGTLVRVRSARQRHAPG